MRITALITWRDRPALAEVLERNAERLGREDVEVLIVNASGNRDVLLDIVRKHGWDGIRIVEMPGQAEFNKSEALNVGVAHAQGDCIFLLDTDVLLTSDFMERGAEAATMERCFATVEEVVESEPEMEPRRWRLTSAIRERSVIRRLTAENGNSAEIEHRMFSEGKRSGPGLIVVRRDDYIAVGGFNSDLRGWGFEDYDFQLRLQLQLGLERRVFGTAMHLTHKHAAVGDTNNENAAACYSNYHAGRFIGNYERDVAAWDDRTIELR